jgi:hypothetical protein
VTILVEDTLQASLLNNLTRNTNLFESCAVSIGRGNKQVNIIGVYKPPDASVDDFNTSFFHMINIPTVIRSKCAILGDFNINLAENNLPRSTKYFCDEFRSNTFFPVITEPTRVTENSSTLIDHIWTNYINSKSGVIQVNISDHYIIFIQLNNVFDSQSTLCNIEYRDHSRNNIANFRNNVLLFVEEFNNIHLNDLDIACNIFCNGLYNAYNSACPIKTKIISKKRLECPWLTKPIIKCINRKHDLYRQYLAGRCEKQVFTRYKDVLSSIIRIAKKQYYNNRFESSINDIKQTWKNIRKLISPQSSKNKEIMVLNDHNVLENDPKKVANILNDYFSSVSENLERSIPHTNVDPLSFVSPSMNSFVCFPTTDVEIKKLILSHKNKGCDFNSIPSSLYKIIADIICNPLSILINKSFSLGIFPECFKTSRLVPIFKKGSKNDCKNYRPISTLHFISKIFEKSMFNRIYNFVEKFNIVYPNQYGFMKHRSTSDAILHFTDNIYETLNKGFHEIAIFLDFSKAFDTVNHEILLKKLYKYGIRGNSNNWFKSYLLNRKQYVTVNNIKSSLLHVNSGIPQGSNLGPLLFILYINDMCHSAPNATFIHYADDTTISITDHDQFNLVHTVNNALQSIDVWLQCNKLSLNIGKTYYLLFSNKINSLPSDIKIRNIPIKELDDPIEKDVKFLGIYLDNKLNFKFHFKYLRSKLSRTAGLLRKMSYIVPKDIIKKLYLSLIMPNISYAIQVWGSTSKTDITAIKNIMCKCNKLFNDLPIVSNKIMSFDQLYSYFILCSFYKLVINKESNYFLNKISSMQIQHSHGTRFKAENNISFSHIRISKMYCSFLYQGVKRWNCLPLEVKINLKAHNFKKKLKLYIYDSND